MADVNIVVLPPLFSWPSDVLVGNANTCSLFAQFYAGGPINATCLQVVQRNACNNPGLEQVSTSEISGGEKIRARKSRNINSP